MIIIIISLVQSPIIYKVLERQQLKTLSHLVDERCESLNTLNKVLTPAIFQILL